MEYSPDIDAINRRALIKKFGNMESPPPVLNDPLPFKVSGLNVVFEKPKGKYVVPIILHNNNTIYTTVKIFNLPLSLTRRELESFIAKNTTQNVSALTFVVDREKKIFRGFVFCGLDSNNSANIFVKEIDGKIIDNCKIAAVLIKK